MKFILYAQTSSYGIPELPDAVDSGSFSLLNSFSRILSELGEITQIHSLKEAENIYAECLERNEACLLFSFAPPHLTPISLTCPVVPVFAWQYPNIPEQIEERSWQGDRRHDWRFVLSKSKGAVVLSTYARDAIQRSMSDVYPVVAVPWPLSLNFTDHGFTTDSVPNLGQGAILSIRGSVGDSQQMGVSADGIICEEEDDTPPFDPADLVDLPVIDHTIRRFQSVPVDSAVADIDEPGLVPPPRCNWEFPPAIHVRTRLRGIVYTTVLTPSLYQDNWEDLITAFCWSFRDTEDATLILVVDDPVPHDCQTKLVILLTRLSPFRCRVLAIYGIPAADEYAELIRATTYYVSATYASGSCRRVADFLAAGVPAMAPAHSGLGDLIDADTAFVIRSRPGIPRAWPHGDGDIYRTSWHQIDWQSLVDAFHKSRLLAIEEPTTYRAMARSAKERARTRCSNEAIKSTLQRFVHDVTAQGPIVHHEQGELSSMMNLVKEA